MKKILMFLGMASMLAATPVLAASATHKTMPVKHTASVCMVHGKKHPCHLRVAHKRTHRHHTVAMAKKQVKSY